MFSLLSLLALVAPAFAADDDFTSLLSQARGSLLAGEYRDARDLLASAEEIAPESSKLISQRDLARLYFYRGVLYWRASPESSALEAWRQTLTIAPEFEPDDELLPDQAEQDVFHALLDEVTGKGEITLDLPEDPGENAIYVDGRTLEPTDTVIAGQHLIQIRCEGGDIESSWYTFGAPPKDYLTICEGGAYKTSRSSSSSSSSKSSSSSSKSSSSSSKSSSSSSKSSSSSRPRDLDEEEKPEKVKDPKKAAEVGKNVAGGSLIALGVGGGVAAVLLYDGAASASAAYDAKWAAAEDNENLRAAANEYYDDVLVPRYTQFYAATGASVVFLAGGVILVAIDAEGPMITPVPGGGMFTWSGRF